MEEFEGPISFEGPIQSPPPPSMMSKMMHEIGIPSIRSAIDLQAALDGAPTILDVLPQVALDQLANIALNAPMMTAPESGVIPIHEQAIDLFRDMLSVAPKRDCFIVFEQHEPHPNAETIVVSAFVGNGPKARETARLYAVAREAVLLLVLHARAKQREIDTLRESLHALVQPSASPNGEEGGSD